MEYVSPHPIWRPSSQRGDAGDRRMHKEKATSRWSGDGGEAASQEPSEMASKPPGAQGEAPDRFSLTGL